MKKIELENCTFVKTMLMLVIVWYHSIIFWTGSWIDVEPVYTSNVFHYLAKWMNSFHIYAFTLVSGYIFYYVKYEAGKYQEFIPFVMNKAKRLVVPYVFVALIWAIPIGTLLFDWDFRTILKNYVLGIQPNQLWFLLMLFFVFVIFWLISDFSQKYTGKSFVLTVCFYALGLVASRKIPNVYMVWTACQYVLFFWIGFKIRQCGLEWLERIPWWLWIAIDIILFVLQSVIPANGGISTDLLALGARILLQLWGACMAFVVLEKLAKRVNWKSSKAFAFISAKSMPIYLFHQQIIYFSVLLLNGKASPYIHAALNFVLAFGGAVLITVIFNKYQWTRFLIGEK